MAGHPFSEATLEWSTVEPTYLHVVENLVVHFRKLVWIITLDDLISNYDKLTAKQGARCNDRLDDIITNILKYYVILRNNSHGTCLSDSCTAKFDRLSPSGPTTSRSIQK